MITAVPVSGTDANLQAALSAAGLPMDDVEDTGRSFFCIIERDGQRIGFGGFELYGEDARLRSVAVPEDRRGTGAGRLVTETLLGEISSAGGKRVYLLTTTAASFFKHLGFDHIDRTAAPAAILATRQASSICTSAALLWRAI
jgi:N-acetylglutamate synthase-like GNAT family acetyltransferase